MCCHSVGWYEDASAAVDSAKHRSRSDYAVIRVCDDVCSEQSAYGNGAGVVAVALKSSVVSDVGLGPSSGVGVGVASDFVLAPCPAPWLAPCPAPFDCRAREGCMVCALNVLNAPCLWCVCALPAALL
jgi:hypothetical protein